MSEHGQDMQLHVPLYVDADFDIDDDGICSIVCLIYANDDEPEEVFVDFEGVVESFLDFHSQNIDYQTIYSLAHEFNRMSERLREKACLIEDSQSAVNILFDISDD
jgi:sulfur transfer protein SufE